MRRSLHFLYLEIEEFQKKNFEKKKRRLGFFNTEGVFSFYFLFFFLKYEASLLFIDRVFENSQAEKSFFKKKKNLKISCVFQTLVFSFFEDERFPYVLLFRLSSICLGF